MLDNNVNPEIAKQFGLSQKEFDLIKSGLNRPPNLIELCLLSSLWSEKKLNSTIFNLLKLFNQSGKAFLNTSETNKSLVKLDDTSTCCLKISSNDVQSKSEPYFEAANCLTNAGRIVLASGSVPIASLNSFHFGLPDLQCTKTVSSEYLKGIGEIGNSSGYPILGAKICFEKCFNEKPELNTLVVGLINDQLIKNTSKIGTDYSIYIVGSEISPEIFKDEKITGKAELGALRSMNINEAHAGLNEKILHESTIEAIEQEAVYGLEAIDKKGLIYGLTEIANSTGQGLNLELQKVIKNKREEDIINFLSSGHFAKLILLVEKSNEKQLEKIYEKWEINCHKIGHLCEERNLRVQLNSKIVAEIPLDLFKVETSFPILSKQTGTAGKIETDETLGLDEIKLPGNLKEVAWSLIKNPNIASKKWINEQYDSMAGVGNLCTNFQSDSCLINLKGTNNAIALCMTGNHKHIKANPFIGTQIAVAAAIRKIVCSGAKPLAIIPGISFVNVNQERDCAILGQIIEGLGMASEKFKLPITNETIKFHDKLDSTDKPISGCPGFTIGMAGILENKNHQMTISFKNKGNIIFLIGPSCEDISASEYLVSYHQKELNFPPFFDIDLENKLQLAIQELINKNYICSAHNVSRGGLFISLVESAMVHSFGFDIITDTDIRLDAFLFGESQGRVVVSINPNKEAHFIDLMMKKDIPFLALGHVTKGEMRVDDISFGFIEDARKAYEYSLEKIMGP